MPTAPVRARTSAVRNNRRVHLETRLDTANVVRQDGSLASFAQPGLGRFKAAKLVAPGVIKVRGPDSVYSTGRLIKPAPIDPRSIGHVLLNGTSGFAILIFFKGQSNQEGATSLGGVPDTENPPSVINTRAAHAKFLCWGAGLNPTPAVPSTSGLKVVLPPSAIASYVQARDGINPFVQRDTSAYSMCLTIAEMLGEDDVVVGANDGRGSTGYRDRIGGFAGSRATVVASFAANKMTVHEVVITTGENARGLLSVSALMMVHPQLPAGIAIEAYESGELEGFGGVYRMNMAVPAPIGPLSGITTADPLPQVKKNYELMAATFRDQWLAAGKTPILLCVDLSAFEAEGNLSAIPFGLNVLQFERDFATSLGAIIGQAVPPIFIPSQPGAPANNINHYPEDNWKSATPTDALMMTLTNIAKAVPIYSYRLNPATGARYDTMTFGLPLYAADGGAATRPAVHWVQRGHIENGEKRGHFLGQIVRSGGTFQWLNALSAVRYWGENLTILKMNKPVRLAAPEEIAEPYEPGVYGRAGIDGLDDGVKVHAETVTIGGAEDDEVSIVWDDEPSGDQGNEVVTIASGNAPQLIEAQSRNGGPPGFPGAGGPWDAPFAAIGRNGGMRSGILSKAPIGWSVQRGAPIYEEAMHDEINTRIHAGRPGTTLKAMCATMGITPAAVIDFNDADCFPGGTAQYVTDPVTGALYVRGASDIADSADPSWVAPAAGVPGHMLWATQSRLDAFGAVGFADTWHRDLAAWTVFLLVKVASLTPALSQYFWSNCRDANGGGAGVALRQNNGGNLGFTIRAPGNGLVSSINVGASRLGWNVMALRVALNASLGASAVSALSLTSKDCRYALTPKTFAGAMTVAPGTGAPQTAPAFGHNGIGGTNYMAAGNAIGAALFVNGALTLRQMKAFFYAMTARAAEIEVGA